MTSSPRSAACSGARTMRRRGSSRLSSRAGTAQTPAREVIGQGDLFWTNVIFRDGLPAALIDWELARSMTRTLEVALAATYWACIRIDGQLLEWGLPLDRRGERLRLLCDAYGMDTARRSTLLDELITHRRSRIARGEWRALPLREVIVALNLEWTEAHVAELRRFLC